MNVKPSCLAVALLAAALVNPALAQQKNSGAGKPLATVNGSPISSSMADAIIKEQVGRGAPDNEDLRKTVRTQLVQREVIAQEARKKGVDKNSTVQARMEFVRQEVLINAYIEDYLTKNPIPETQLRGEYDKIVKAAGDKEYKARHILVEKEDEAQAIIKKLQSGAKFEELAKDSKDPGSKDRGGDLGWSRPSSFVQPFGEAMVSLEKGKFTPQPVRTQYGYHVILLEDVRKFDPPKFEDIKGNIEQRLKQQVVQKHVADLVSKAKVVE